MQMLKVSVLGMYRANPHLFDGLTLPQEWQLSKQNCINQILLQCSCFEILYPDPEFLQEAISIWSETQQNVWYKFAQTLIFDYDPIHNYDRTETETISRSGTGNSTQRNTGTQTNNHTGSDESLVSAFNATTFQPESKIVYGGIDSRIDNLTSSAESEASQSETRTLNIAGNIGTMTTQEMIQQQREIIDVSMQQYIVDDFKKKFCILVY